MHICTWSTVHLFHGCGATLRLNLAPLAEECQTHLSCDHIKMSDQNFKVLLVSMCTVLVVLDELTVAGEQNISRVEISTQDALLMQTLQG